MSDATLPTQYFSEIFPKIARKEIRAKEELEEKVYTNMINTLNKPRDEGYDTKGGTIIRGLRELRNEAIKNNQLEVGGKVSKLSDNLKNNDFKNAASNAEWLLTADIQMRPELKLALEDTLYRPKQDIDRTIDYINTHKEQFLSQDNFYFIKNLDKLHAEMNIIDYLEYNSQLKDIKYIGNSKLCCATCYEAIKVTNEVFGADIKTSGTHAKFDFPWYVPAFIHKTGKMASKLNANLYAYSSITPTYEGQAQARPLTPPSKIAAQPTPLTTPPPVSNINISTSVAPLPSSKYTHTTSTTRTYAEAMSNPIPPQLKASKATPRVRNSDETTTATASTATPPHTAAPSSAPIPAIGGGVTPSPTTTTTITTPNTLEQTNTQQQLPHAQPKQTQTQSQSQPQAAQPNAVTSNRKGRRQAQRQASQATTTPPAATQSKAHADPTSGANTTVERDFDINNNSRKSETLKTASTQKPISSQPKAPAEASTITISTALNPKTTNKNPNQKKKNEKEKQHLTRTEKENITNFVPKGELNEKGKYNLNARLAAVNDNQGLLDKLDREAAITANIDIKAIDAKKSVEAEKTGTVEIRAEHNHSTEHGSNNQALIAEIQSGTIDKNTVIAIERKQYGENQGMKDIIKIANILEHNEKNPDNPLKLPEKLENTLIFQDALLYKTAKENGIKVISLEGRNLEHTKETALYNENREQYMTDVINEVRSKGYNRPLSKLVM